MDALRSLWDFGDLDASERRFRDRLDGEPEPAARADLLSQLARIEGLRGDFARGDGLLDEAEALAGARPRTLLERGRLRRSSGDSKEALLLFESAYAHARAASEAFLAADAAHMAALVDPEGPEAWTERGLEVAADAAYWRGPLLNNLGWARFHEGDFEGALDAFRGALAAREADPGREENIEIARYAVGKTLRMLGRTAEAAALLETAVAWTARAGQPDGWFHEELAEDYAALGRNDDARVQATLAIPLLEAADPFFGERSARLRALAGI